MSDVKTVVVLLRFRMNSDRDWIYTSESDKFGGYTDYPTAHDFIKKVKDMHRNAGSDMEILNVVIG